MKCKGCTKELPPRAPGTVGRTRLWCSDNCRKRAHEREVVARCPDCSKGMPRGFVSHGYSRCVECHRAADRRWFEARAGIIADLWEDGAKCSTIAEAFDWTTTQLGVEMARIRSELPGLLPHRRTPEQVERIRNGWAAARKAAA